MLHYYANDRNLKTNANTIDIPPPLPFPYPRCNPNQLGAVLKHTMLNKIYFLNDQAAPSRIVISLSTYSTILVVTPIFQVASLLTSKEH